LKVSEEFHGFVSDVIFVVLVKLHLMVFLTQGLGF